MKQYEYLGSIAVMLALSACASGQQGSAPAAPSTGASQEVPTSLGSIVERGLASILSDKLGISSDQALGGLGSIFKIAKQRMVPSDFAKVSSAVPGMDQYLAAAVQPQAQQSGNGALLSAASAVLGGENSTLGSLASLAGSFQSLGMKPSMVGKFVPVILDYVKQQGGSSTMSLLESALR
jgi:hypothetical protein